MPIEIQELHTRVDVVDPAALLTPQVLEQIVAEVLRRLDERNRAGASRASELQVASVVRQQREHRGL